MKFRLRWQGWKAEFTPRALRLLVITAVLVLAAGAEALPPNLRPLPESSPLVDTVRLVSFSPDRADSIKQLVALPPAPPPLVQEPVRSAPALQQKSSQPRDSEELRNRALLLPLPGLSVRELHDSFEDVRDGGSRRHHAIDITAARGTPVLSVDDGAVVKLHYGQFGGISLYARDPSGRFLYYYAHLDSYHPSMRLGLPLTRGDTIGFVGTTGNAAADTPHLHFAVLRSARGSVSGKPLNPFALFQSSTR